MRERLPETVEAMRCGIISTDTLGEAFEPEQRFEAPDGSDIIFNRDYFGEDRSGMPVAGPFAKLSRRTVVWK